MPEKLGNIQETLIKRNSTPQTHENRTHEFPPICDFSIVNGSQRKSTVNDSFCHQVFNVMVSMETWLHLLAFKFLTVAQQMVGRKEMLESATPSTHLFTPYIKTKEKLIECLLILHPQILKNRGDR